MMMTMTVMKMKSYCIVTWAVTSLQCAKSAKTLCKISKIFTQNSWDHNYIQACHVLLSPDVNNSKI